jgi:hypothetical protein
MAKTRRGKRGPGKDGLRRIFKGQEGPRESVVPERHQPLTHGNSEAPVLSGEIRHQITHNIVEHMGRIARMALSPEGPLAKQQINIQTAGAIKQRPKTSNEREIPRNWDTSFKKYSPFHQRLQYVWERETRDLALKPAPYQNHIQRPTENYKVAKFQPQKYCHMIKDKVAVGSNDFL